MTKIVFKNFSIEFKDHNLQTINSVRNKKEKIHKFLREKSGSKEKDGGKNNDLNNENKMSNSMDSSIVFINKIFQPYDTLF